MRDSQQSSKFSCLLSNETILTNFTGVFFFNGSVFSKQLTKNSMQIYLKIVKCCASISYKTIYNAKKISNILCNTIWIFHFQAKRVIMKKKMPPPIPRFRAEHPFVHFILDDKRCPIFNGQLTHPKKMQCK